MKGEHLMSVNQRIKQVRQALNLSQAKFAKEISISNGYIASIELEKRNVNDRLIKLVCITFNVSEHWLRTGNGDMFEEQPNNFFKLASATFKELKPEYQEYILKQIDQLLDVQRVENCNLTNKENDTQNAPNKEFITLTVPAEDEELYRRALKERELIKRKKSSSSISTNYNIQENSL